MFDPGRRAENHRGDLGGEVPWLTTPRLSFPSLGSSSEGRAHLVGEPSMQSPCFPECGSWGAAGAPRGWISPFTTKRQEVTYSYRPGAQLPQAPSGKGLLFRVGARSLGSTEAHSPALTLKPVKEAACAWKLNSEPKTEKPKSAHRGPSLC